MKPGFLIRDDQPAAVEERRGFVALRERGVRNHG